MEFKKFTLTPQSVPAGLPQIVQQLQFYHEKKKKNLIKPRFKSGQQANARKTSDSLMEVGMVVSLKGQEFLICMSIQASTLV